MPENKGFMTQKEHKEGFWDIQAVHFLAWMVAIWALLYKNSLNSMLSTFSNYVLCH